MIRTTRPVAGNKYFITKSNGGYSTCIKGKPTDSQCDVLSNCVGYACGAFNEELDLGYEKYHLNCNAERFIERAIASGLNVYKTPSVGDIICWEGKDSRAGHVAIVIDVIDSNTILTAESGYGNSKPFWITKRKNNNGRWGTNSNYPLRGFIENPNYPHVKPVPPTPEPEPTPEPTPTPTPTKDFKVGDKVVPIKLVDYKGTHLIQYDKEYTIMQIDKRGAVLGAPRKGKLQVWAVLKLDNIKKVG